MALGFRVFSVLIALSTFVSSRSQIEAPKFPKALQADICEMLRDHENDAEIRYPNEYYDCHAHGRYFKEASLAPRKITLI